MSFFNEVTIYRIEISHETNTTRKVSLKKVANLFVNYLYL